MSITVGGVVHTARDIAWRIASLGGGKFFALIDDNRGPVFQVFQVDTNGDTTIEATFDDLPSDITAQTIHEMHAIDESRVLIVGTPFALLNARARVIEVGESLTFGSWAQLGLIQTSLAGFRIQGLTKLPDGKWIALARVNDHNEATTQFVFEVAGMSVSPISDGLINVPHLGEGDRFFSNLGYPMFLMVQGTDALHAYVLDEPGDPHGPYKLADGTATDLPWFAGQRLGVNNGSALLPWSEEGTGRHQRFREAIWDGEDLDLSDTFTIGPEFWQVIGAWPTASSRTWFVHRYNPNGPFGGAGAQVIKQGSEEATAGWLGVPDATAFDGQYGISHRLSAAVGEHGLARGLYVSLGVPHHRLIHRDDEAGRLTQVTTQQENRSSRLGPNSYW